MPKISIFQNTTDTKNPVVVDSSEVVEMIRTGRWKSKISEINLLPHGSKEQDQMKRTLNAITWQGIFSERNDAGIIGHSGLVACDFDHIPESDWQKYWDALSKLPFTYCLFKSPRRDGMKAIIRIPPDIQRHKQYLAGVRNLFRDAPYYDHYDDISRLCYGSYDPDLYFNPDAKVFSVLISAPSIDQSYTGECVNLIPAQYHEAFDQQYGWLNHKKLSYYINGNKHIFLFRLFCACNRVGIPQEESISLALSKCRGVKDVDYVPDENFITLAKDAYRRYSGQFGSRPLSESKPVSVHDEIESINTKSSFPLSVLPDEVRNYINDLNYCLNYSKDFLAIATMWALATINGNKYKLRVKNGWISATTFWFAAVGESGVMKSHPIDTVISAIKHIDRETKSVYDHDLEQWEVEESSCQRSKQRNTTPRPKFKQIIVSDFTLESLHLVHNINRRGIGLYKDELVGFLHDMNKYRKGSDEQFWLESFNNKGYPVNRVTREPLMIEDTMINILGSIQPEILMKITKEMEGNGMINRFLFTTNETEIFPINKSDISQEMMWWWDNSIKSLNNHIVYIDNNDTVILEMTDEALDKMIAIDCVFCDLQKSDDEAANMKNYISKMKTYLPRFALLMWLFDLVYNGCSGQVTVDHMNRAELICNYFITSARFVFNDADKRTEMDGVIKKISGSTKVEKILALSVKGYKGVEICKMLSTSANYVSRTINGAKVAQ